MLEVLQNEAFISFLERKADRHERTKIEGVKVYRHETIFCSRRHNKAGQEYIAKYNRSVLFCRGKPWQREDPSGSS